MKSHGRLLVISPHLDDAVLSCGLLLAANPAAVVCTVFTAPPAENLSTDWDRASGFANASEAMQARKAEDVNALALLGAHPLHLPFCDAQYQSSPSHETLVAALSRAFADIQPATVLIPLGLFHSDHTLVAHACLSLMAQDGQHDPREKHRAQPISMHAYEDVPYRHMPGVVQARLAELAERGYVVCPADELAGAPAANDAHQQMKHAAIGAYESQLRAFGPDGQANLFSPERYWRLHDKAPT